MRGRIGRVGEHGLLARHLAQEEQPLPLDFDYRAVRGLSNEAQQKLNLHKPATLGQAGRISGITPAAVALLLVHLKRGFAPAFAAAGAADTTATGAGTSDAAAMTAAATTATDAAGSAAGPAPAPGPRKSA